MTDDSATELCIWVGLCLVAMFGIAWVCRGVPFLWGLIWTG